MPAKLLSFFGRICDDFIKHIVDLIASTPWTRKNFQLSFLLCIQILDEELSDETLEMRCKFQKKKALADDLGIKSIWLLDSQGGK